MVSQDSGLRIEGQRQRRELAGAGPGGAHRGAKSPWWLRRGSTWVGPAVLRVGGTIFVSGRRSPESHRGVSDRPHGPDVVAPGQHVGGAGCAASRRERLRSRQADSRIAPGSVDRPHGAGGLCRSAVHTPGPVCDWDSRLPKPLGGGRLSLGGLFGDDPSGGRGWVSRSKTFPRCGADHHSTRSTDRPLPPIGVTACQVCTAGPASTEGTVALSGRFATRRPPPASLPGNSRATEPRP